MNDYPSPQPPPRSGEGETKWDILCKYINLPALYETVAVGLPLSASGRGLGGGVILALLLLALPHAARAHKAYAIAEGVSCAYCHENPKGGGTRNYRGAFYAKQMHSFAGFNDEAEAKAAGVEIGPEAGSKPASLVAGKSVLPPPVPKPTPPAAPAEPKPPFTDPRNVPDFGEWQSPEGIVFIKIPAGNYVRGTTDAQKEALQKAGQWSPLNRVEQPAETVTISRPFLVSKTEITQKQWNALMVPPPPPVVIGKNGKPVKPKVKPAVNPAAFQNGDDAPARPVENVSWNDAKAFCRTLRTASQADGDTSGKYRLPTEAEWEYAARAGSPDLYPLGPDKKPVTPETLNNMAWMNANAKNTTHPVGQKTPNAWGLCDMAGNVWEWCEDAYSPTAYRDLPTTDPLYQSKFATERVMRGGCWFLDARAQRVGLRGGNLPTLKSQYVGFRVVREM